MEKQTQKNQTKIYMKVDFQNSIARLFLVLYKVHQN